MLSPIVIRSQKNSKKEEIKKECELVAMTSTRISKEETDGVWKSMVVNKYVVDLQLFGAEIFIVYFHRLQRILGISKLSELIDTDSINPEHIIHNVSHVSKNGVVTNIPKSGN